MNNPEDEQRCEWCGEIFYDRKERNACPACEQEERESGSEEI